MSDLGDTNNVFNEAALHFYQHNAVRFIENNPSCALFLDPGLGKTIITLTALSKLLRYFEISKILVIAPLRVVKSVWQQEAQKWHHTQDLKLSLVIGTPRQRQDALVQPADIYVTNYENIPWLIKHHYFDFDTVVFDELSKMKSSQTKRFKAFKKVLTKVSRIIGLTGTPASNGLLDLYAQIYLLDQGERLGKAFYHYRRHYFTSDYMGYNWTLKSGAAESIYKKVQDICLTLSGEDYLKLPRRIDNRILIQLPTNVKQRYKHLERDFILELEQGTISVPHAAALSNKLLQYCNGALYVDDQGTWEEIHQAKLEALEDVINDAAGQNMMVAYHFKSDKARIQAQFKHAVGIDEPDAIERWNEGEIELLLVHPASAGHGLNLQRGGHMIVWFGFTWSLEHYQQLNARLYRQGQIKPVIVHHLIAVDTQ